jgi:hypothetical protein
MQHTINTQLNACPWGVQSSRKTEYSNHPSEKEGIYFHRFVGEAPLYFPDTRIIEGKVGRKVTPSISKQDLVDIKEELSVLKISFSNGAKRISRVM